MTILECEWCHMKYPIHTFVYWKMRIYSKESDYKEIKEHIICDDCKKELKEV